MKSRYLCAYHIEQMQACESEAIEGWSRIMHCGLRAYTECRTSNAYTYLGAALDIALLRSECPLNGIFSELHAIKPAEFLIQLYIAEGAFDRATLLLSRLSAMGKLAQFPQGPTLEDFIDFQCRRIGILETQRLSRNGLPRFPESVQQAGATPRFRTH